MSQSSRERLLATASLALFLVTLGLLARPYVFNSDDVGLQTVLDTWRPGRGDVRVGEDTFLLKAPIYLVANAVGTSKAVLTGTSLALNAIGWVLLLVGGRTMLRRWAPGDGAGGGALAALWLAGLGGVFATLLLRPNIRNLEIGLAVLLVALLARLGDVWPSLSRQRRVLCAAGVVLLLAALFVDDPYFAYVVFGPMAAVVAVVSLLRRERAGVAWLPAALVLAAVVVWQVAFVALRALDFRPAGEPREAPELSEAGRAVGRALDAVRTVANAETAAGASGWWDVRAAVNLVVLVVVLLAGAWVLARLARRDAWALAVALLPISVVGAYVVSGHSLREFTDRYVVLVVVAAAAFAAAALRAGGPTVRRAVTAALVAGLFVNIAGSVARAVDAEPNPGNVVDEVVPTLDEEQLRRGFADYWYANTITYGSGFDIDVLPVVCANGRVERRPAYVDAARYRTTEGPSFYLYDAAMGSCALEELRAQFGPPERTVRLTLGRRILVYPYDLATRIP